MSTLRSAVDELRAENIRMLSDEALSDRLDELERTGRVLEAERSRAIAEVERRRSFARDGHLSAAAWLAHRQGLSLTPFRRRGGQTRPGARGDAGRCAGVRGG